ncbi:MAG: ADP-ribosylglycohydrolase family protein [Haliangiales bacterium]
MQTRDTEHQQRITLARLALDGLSVGDAFGERFLTAPAAAAGMVEGRALPAERPWRWTDDTAMALSIVEVLVQHRCIERDALAQAFARRYAAEPKRGYGRGAHSILRAIGAGQPWPEVAAGVFGGSGSYGNGAAMRSAPIGGYFWDDYARVVSEAGASAAPTHAHPEGRAGAIAVAIAAAAAARMARGELERSGASLLQIVADHCPTGATKRGVEEAQSIPLSEDVATAAAALGNGSDVSAQDTVPLCMWCAARHLDSFEEAMWETVSAEGDRDTNCAIVGGVLALVVGQGGIPAPFLEAREDLPQVPATPATQP